MRTTCSPRSFIATRASRRKRSIAPGRLATSAWRSLTATGSWSWMCVAATTTPMPPAPSVRSTRYFRARRVPGRGAFASEGIARASSPNPTPGAIACYARPWEKAYSHERPASERPQGRPERPDRPQEAAGRAVEPRLPTAPVGHVVAADSCLQGRLRGTVPRPQLAGQELDHEDRQAPRHGPGPRPERVHQGRRARHEDGADERT